MSPPLAGRFLTSAPLGKSPLSLFFDDGHNKVEDREAIFSVQNCVAFTHPGRAGGLVLIGTVSVEPFQPALMDSYGINAFITIRRLFHICLSFVRVSLGRDLTLQSKFYSFCE